MAMCPESRDWFREIGKSTEKYQWDRSVFWWMWRIHLGPYLFGVMTPWFYISVSTGTQEFIFLGARWYGIRASWSHPPAWKLASDNLLFYRGDNFLSFVKHEQQETFNG